VTNRSCEEVRDLLVDYADGELPPQDSQAVAEHLAGCSECRQIVKNLQRSLDLAKAIWLDNLEADRSEAAGNGPITHRLRWVAVAAAILVTAGGTLLLSMFHKSSSSTATYAQIEEQATRASAAARLLAATQVLAKCQGTESIVEQQARYILSHYGDTPAASELKTTLPSILKGATYD
jgi:anti-sigma factor RsiW